MLTRHSGILGKASRALFIPTAVSWWLNPSIGRSAVAYSYVSDQTSYNAAPGATVAVTVYLKETLTNGSVSLIAGDGGLFGAGWSVARTGTLPGSPSSLASLGGSVTNNGLNFPSGFFINKSGGSVSTMAGDEAVSPAAMSGPMPNALGLIELGVIDITAGSASGVTTFSLANYSYPAVTDGYTDTFNTLYDLDATRTGTAAFTGAGTAPESFTVTVAGIPANISSGAYFAGSVYVGGPQNSVAGNGVLNVSGTGQLTVNGPLVVTVPAGTF